MATTTFPVPDIDCPTCAENIREGLLHLPGVQRVEVKVDHRLVTVEFDPATVDESLLKHRVRDLGFTPI